MVVISHRKHKQMEETGNKQDVCTEYHRRRTLAVTSLAEGQVNHF